MVLFFFSDQNTLAAIRQQQMMQQQLKAIANTPFGDSPLFRNLAATGDKKVILFKRCQ